MCNRKNKTKVFKRTQPPYWDGVEKTTQIISKSNFLLSYKLSTTDDYPLPKNLYQRNHHQTTVFGQIDILKSSVH